jgi:hypothetical protein
MDQFGGQCVEPFMTAPLPRSSFGVRPDLRPLKVFGGTLALLGVTLAALAAASGNGPATVVIGVAGFGAVSLLCLLSVAAGLHALLSPKPLSQGLAVLTVLGPVIGGAAMSFFGAFMALWATSGFQRG